MLVVAALLARQAVVGRQAAVAVPAGVVALLGLFVLGVLATRRQRGARLAAESGGPGGDPVGARAVTGVVVLTATAALVTELLLRR